MLSCVGDRALPRSSCGRSRASSCRDGALQRFMCSSPAARRERCRRAALGAQTHPRDAPSVRMPHIREHPEPPDVVERRPTWSVGSEPARCRRASTPRSRARWLTRSATQCLQVPPMAAHSADRSSRRLLCAPHPLGINECVSRVHVHATGDQLDPDRVPLERSSPQTPMARTPTSSVDATVRLTTDDTVTNVHVEDRQGEWLAFRRDVDFRITHDAETVTIATRS